MAPLGQFSVPGPAFRVKPGRKAAGKRVLRCSGAAVSRKKAVGAGPEEGVGHWTCLVGMRNTQRSEFHLLGEFQHSPSLGGFFPRGESLLPSSMTNLPHGLCAPSSSSQAGSSAGAADVEGKGEAQEAGSCSGDSHVPQLPLSHPATSFQSIFPRPLLTSRRKSTASPWHQPSPSQITVCHGAQGATLPVPGCSRHWQVPRYHGNAAKVHIFS